MSATEVRPEDGEEERRRLQEQDTDLRTWHINNQDIPSSPYSKRKQVVATLCATMGADIVGGGCRKRH